MSLSIPLWKWLACYSPSTRIALSQAQLHTREGCAYAFCHLIAEIRSFPSFFYSFIYSFTNRQGPFSIDVLRQKCGLSGATSLSSQVPSTSKKPLRVVRLSPILEEVKTISSYGLPLVKRTGENEHLRLFLFLKKFRAVVTK